MPLGENRRNVHLYNNITLSPEQIAQVLWQAGMQNVAAIAQLLPIAARESGGRAGVQGTTMGYGARSGDMGLFQINWGAHGQTLLNAGIIKSHTDLYNPVINARAAVYLSNNGDPGRMRQLWGVANGTWAGTRGTLPAPNYDAVRRAQSGGYLGRPYQGGGGPGYTPGGAGVPPGYGMMPGTPPPGVATAYYDQLYRSYGNDLLLNSAQTQSAVDYAKRQQAFADSLAGYQQAGLGIKREQLALENKYQNDIAALNQGLSKKQADLNRKEWRQIAANLDALKKLEARGMQSDKKYYQQQISLQKQIRAATTKYLQQQGKFNQRDYALALQQITNVVTTEAARWAEVQRLTAREASLARQKQTFIAKGANEAYGQAVKEAQFVENEQRREAGSDATARGAMSSRGYGQDLRSFEKQRGLAQSGAQVSRDDVLRMSQNQLASEIERIGQAHRAGKISYQDAVRQASTARSRAKLGFDQNAAAIGRDWSKAWTDYQAGVFGAQHQWSQDYLRYLTANQQLDNTRKMGWIGFEGQQAGLTAQMQQAARTQAYNNALYATNLALTNNSSGSIAAQLAQAAAAAQYGIDQTYLGGVMDTNAINRARAGVAQDQLGTIGSTYGGGGGFSYPTGVPGSRGAQQQSASRASSGYRVQDQPWYKPRTGRKANVYVPSYN